MDYREFLQSANGGCPEIDTFEDENGEDWAINNFFFICPDADSNESIVWNHLNRWPGITPDFLPIGRDGGGNLFLLNISPTQSDEVWIWVHDEPENPLRKLSDRFEEFIDGLHSNPDYI